MLVVFFNLVALGLIVFLVWRTWYRELGHLFWPGLLTRVLGGIALGLIYREYYGVGDTLVFFEDGSLLAALAREYPLRYIDFLFSGDLPDAIVAKLHVSDPRSLFFEKFVSLLNLISGDNYWVSATYLSVLSFLSAWYLCSQLTKAFPAMGLAAYIAFLFFPSVVLWTSGLIKEALAASALFYLTGYFLRFWSGRIPRLFSLVPVIVACAVLWNLKYYYAGVLLPVIFALIAYRSLRPMIAGWSFASRFAVWFAMLLVPFILISFLHPNFHLQAVMDVIVGNSEAYRAFSAPEDQVQFHELKPDVISILRNAPLALVSGLYRPFVWEAGNVLQFISGVENLLLLALSLAAARQIPAAMRSPDRLLIFATLVYIALLCICLTLSTPNFGTLSRYRIGYLPYFVLLTLSGIPFVTHIPKNRR